MTMRAREAALRRERSMAEHIPYTAHVAPNVLRTVQGDYLQALRLGGASFETADDGQLNAWQQRLNLLWRSIATPTTAIWTHVVRRREIPVAGGSAADGFAARLSRRYLGCLAGETLMTNEIYLAIVYRPVTGVTGTVFSRALSRAREEALRAELRDSLDVCEKLLDTVRASLARYEPEVLGCYRAGSRWCSSLLEYLGLLTNGELRQVGLTRRPVREALATSRLLFGTEVIEYRTPTQTRLGAMLGLKEYATPTMVGMYDRLLSAPFPFVLTQSFTFLARATGQGLLRRQHHRMLNAGDFAVSQAEELTRALDALTSNEFAMGDHHFSLQVLCDLRHESAHESAEGSPPLKILNDRIALARSLLADTGMTVAREDLALEAAFWAQLPGNFSMRARRAPITSRNFAAMAGFHNYPTGRAEGNHWGRALTVLMTSARSAYHFSLHASDPTDQGGIGRRDAGHTLICGPTGSGKTVFIGFLIAMLSLQGVTQVVFDKDRGLEILVRALGGEYLTLSNGAPTGLNPLQLPPTASNVEFLKAWLRALAGAATTVAEWADVEQALRGTLELEPAARRLSRLLEFLDSTQSEGIYARLAPWCHTTRGDYAWVFDNCEDSLVPRLAHRSVFGVDVTEFIEHDVARTPVTLYLFHLVRQLLDGRRFVCWLDEFWRLLGDAAFESFANDAPRTWRKLNAVMCLATQSVADVLASPISRTLIEQTPTKIFFPNSNARACDYIEGLGLSEREFRIVRDELETGARAFLVKQGLHSIVCQLELRGFEAELAVISSRATALREMATLMGEKGAAPSQWLPEFMRRAERGSSSSQS